MATDNHKTTHGKDLSPLGAWCLSILFCLFISFGLVFGVNGCGSPKRQRNVISAGRDAVLAMNLDEHTREVCLNRLGSYSPSWFTNSCPDLLVRETKDWANLEQAKRHICALTQDLSARAIYYQKLDNAQTTEKIEAVLAEAKLLSAAGPCVSSCEPLTEAGLSAFHHLREAK